MKIEFRHDAALGELLAEWWRDLANHKGARAELRRCASADAAEMTAAYQRLYYSKLRPLLGGEEGAWNSRMAAIVGLASHLKHGDNVNAGVLKASNKPVELFAGQMAEPMSAERALVSELRFRRLLQHEREQLYPAMIRVIRMLNGQANLFGLAESVFYWGEAVKKRWAYAYYAKAPARKSA